MPLTPPQGDPRSDAELISSARLGDPSAWGVLFARHGAAVTAMARYYARDNFTADDLVSEAFERTMAVIRAGGGPDVSFRAYVYTTVRRLAFEQTEKNKRTAVTDDFSAFEMPDEIVDPAVSSFERTLVSDAFARLPERWQAVLWYLEVEGLTPPEVAPMLGLTANGVSALAYRAREGLREQYLQLHVSETPARPDCEAYRGKLGSYARGNLARRDATKVEAHLETCDECTAIVAELRDVGHGMRVIIAPLLLGGAAAAGLGFLQPAPRASAAVVTLARRTRGLHPAVGAAAAVAAVALLAVGAVLLSSNDSPPVADPGPSSAPSTTPSRTAFPSPTTTTSPTRTPTPAPTATSTPRTPPAPPTQQAPTGAPSPTPTPTPSTASLSLALVDVGDLVAGRDGMVGYTVSNLSAVAGTNVRVSLQLPSGVVVDPTREVRASGAEWSCVALASETTCTAPTIPASSSSTVYLPVTVAAAPDMVTPLDASLTADNAAGTTAQAPSVVVPTGLGTRFLVDGHYAVTQVGASFLGCDSVETLCASARDATAVNEVLNNDYWTMVPVDESGAAVGSPSAAISSTTLTIPADAEVSFAGLYWSGLVPTGAPADQLGAITLRTPDGAFESVSAERVDRSAEGDTASYQSYADVTALVSSGGAGSWSATGATYGPTSSGWAGAYAGWTLVVVYADASTPASRVAVFDGFETVDPSASASYVVAGLPNSTVELGIVAWEGDAGLAGDSVTLDGGLLVRNSTAADPANAFTSVADGAGWANSFGVDAGTFQPATLAGSRGTLTTATDGDRYAVGVVTVVTH